MSWGLSFLCIPCAQASTDWMVIVNAWARLDQAPLGDHGAMLRRVLDGQQQKDPKHRVKAEEHRHDIAMPQPFGVPQIVE